MDKKIYFLSDSHLGSLSHIKHQDISNKQVLSLPGKRIASNAHLHSEHEVERKLCRWFDMAKVDARSIFLLGDIFDFWFEYKTVVPRGFTRVLGKISELTDAGIDIHFFIGNHDVWLTDYLAQECGVIVHREPLVIDLLGKKFFLAHGDGLGDKSKSFKVIRHLFHNRFCQKAFATLHPRWALALAHKWSNHSRATGAINGYLGEDKEYLIKFSKQHLQIAPNINFFIYGHRHIMLDLMIATDCRVVILGDWISYFSYGVFDGNNFTLETFEN